VDEVSGLNNDILIQNLDITGWQEFIEDINGPCHL
jgi:hypothetical protein